MHLDWTLKSKLLQLAIGRRLSISNRSVGSQNFTHNNDQLQATTGRVSRSKLNLQSKWFIVSDSVCFFFVVAISLHRENRFFVWNISCSFFSPTRGELEQQQQQREVARSPKNVLRAVSLCVLGKHIANSMLSWRRMYSVDGRREWKNSYKKNLFSFDSKKSSLNQNQAKIVNNENDLQENRSKRNSIKKNLGTVW